MAALDDKFFWILHLTPLAPRCGGPVEDPSRNLMRAMTLGGAVRAMLTRCEMAPQDVRFELQVEGDPVLVRIHDNAPLLFVWAGAELADVSHALATLRDTHWLPATYTQKAAA